MRHKLSTAITILIFIISSFALASSETPKININLDYGDSTIFDSDKDGIETDSSVIDLTVKDTEFSWRVDKTKLCTKWEILSMDKNKITTICYGSELCCNFIGLKPAMQNWNDNLYLTHGKYGASLNNKISSRVIYIDYNLNIENPYSYIYYSDYAYLYAVFLDNNYFSGKSISNKDYKIVEKLERIKTKNKLTKVSLTDDNENPVLNNLDNKNLKLKFFIDGGDKNYDGLDDVGNEIIALTNFKGGEINWGKLEQIFIEKENENLEEHIKKIGLIPRKTITVKGVEEILEENSYEGYIRLDTTGLLYSKVLYCSDNLECNELKECITNHNNCYLRNKDSLEIYIPHFSSVVLALNESDINLTIISPDNTTALESGENIYLNFTTNLAISANYSFDNNPEKVLGTNTIFSDLLEGTLLYNTLENGEHSITITLWDNNSNIAQHNRSFRVWDIYPPNISIKHNGVDLNNSEIHNQSYTSITIISDEYANISYKLNDDDYSTSEDLDSDKTIDLNLDLKAGTNT